jgi:hypothetical protein
VFAASDEMADGAIRAIRRAGLTVPADVAMMGFDDHATAELLDLSSVRQPVTEQGVRLAPPLLAALRGAAEPTDVVVDTELLVRGSTVARGQRVRGWGRLSPFSRDALKRSELRGRRLFLVPPASWPAAALRHLGGDGVPESVKAAGDFCGASPWTA